MLQVIPVIEMPVEEGSSHGVGVGGNTRCLGEAACVCLSCTGLWAAGTVLCRQIASLPFVHNLQSIDGPLAKFSNLFYL